ncbi:MAG: Brp/Blh family beta-carotene 15,15'-dioxygenase, partial [Candidatus Fonsibacter sp.]
KKKLIELTSVLIIVFQVFSVFISFYFTNILIGFTLYFCISHSFKNIINIIYENNKNFKIGLHKFIRDAAPLTLVTFGVLVLMIFAIINNEGLINATLKTIFIGIACLALPHIVLHFLIERSNEKKS